MLLTRSLQLCLLITFGGEKMISHNIGAYIQNIEGKMACVVYNISSDKNMDVNQKININGNFIKIQNLLTFSLE